MYLMLFVIEKERSKTPELKKFNLNKNILSSILKINIVYCFFFMRSIYYNYNNNKRRKPFIYL